MECTGVPGALGMPAKVEASLGGCNIDARVAIDESMKEKSDRNWSRSFKGNGGNQNEL